MPDTLLTHIFDIIDQFWPPAMEHDCRPVLGIGVAIPIIDPIGSIDYFLLGKCIKWGGHSA